MVESGKAFRGMRVGAHPTGAIQGWEAMAGKFADTVPRMVVPYWCARGHETRPVFAPLPDDEIPAVWDCCRCGAPATRDGHIEAPATPEDHFKSHLEYAKERRSPAEAASVLEAALRSLRNRRRP